MGMLLRALALLGLTFAAPLAAEDVAVAHSPWLALRFQQGGADAPLVNTDLLRTEVTLKRAPFTIVLPRRGADDTYQIAAWSDASIFVAANVDARRGPKPLAELPPFFRPGTGYADTAAGSGVLKLGEDAHNHLTGLRLGPDPDRHAVFYSAIGADDAQGEWRETPIASSKGPLYLAVWFDEDGDGIMRHGEYEFLVLNFR